MWQRLQRLKKVDWTGGPLDLIAAVVFFTGLGIWMLVNDTAQAKIQEFNTITHTWSESKR